MNSTTPFKVVTLGCRLNRYESDGMAAILNDSGHFHHVTDTDSAAIIIVNTCTVTDQADSRSRNLIRSLHRKNPSSKILVTGCYADTDPDVIREISGVERVFPNREKSNILPYALALDKSEQQFPMKSGNPFGFPPALPVGRTRAYLKIQDGCSQGCTYCKVPSARGMPLSRSSNDILNMLDSIDESGINEVVITGINAGFYDDPDDGYTLSDLVEIILKQDHSFRVRLSSIEPDLVDEKLIHLLGNERLCNFLHLPLQSGSASILKEMNRTYTPEEFVRVTEKIRKSYSDIFIGSDVMIGFPGETEEDFLDTLDIIKKSQISHVHSFRYSPRKNTKASALPGRVHGNILQERMERLHTLASENKARFTQKMVGQNIRGLVEKTPVKGERGRAISQESLPVYFNDPIETSDRGTIKNFIIVSSDANGELIGKLT